MKNKDFSHLHIHTEYSLLDGAIQLKYLVDKVKDMGFKSVGMADHGNIDGAIKFSQECADAKIKPIIGCELYYVPDAKKKEKGEKRYHLVAYCKNETGFRNLCTMLTYGHLEGFYYRPRVDASMLEKHHEGLVVSAGCASSVIYSPDKIVGKLLAWLKDDFYFEVMPHRLKEYRENNKLMWSLSKKFKKKIIGTIDAHYLNRRDWKLHEVVLCMQTKSKITDPNHWKFDVKGLYVQSADEMIKSFKRQGILPIKTIRKSLENTIEIVEKCDFDLNKKLKVNLPLPKTLKSEISDTDHFRRLIKQGWNTYLNQEKRARKIYKERCKEEMNQIIKQGFERYFLIVWDLVNWCKGEGILVGAGRGSVGASLVAYLLGITNVDPVKYGLIFSRFISPARIDYPDIDLDFPKDRRDDIRKYLEFQYGENSIASVSNFNRLKGKAAVRSVARVHDISEAEVSPAAKAIVVRSSGDFRASFSVEDSFNLFEECKKFKEKYPKIVDYASRLEGMVSHKGMHAAGIVISADDLTKTGQCYLTMQHGRRTANWDYRDLQHRGLLKLDALGLETLSVLMLARKLVLKRKGNWIEFDKIKMTDRKCFKEFSEGNTVGVFQFQSLGLRKTSQQMGVGSFKDICDITSLYRPGCLRAGMLEVYERRKKGLEEPHYVNDYIRNLTKDTFGIILYQEQVMKLAYELGGLPWRTADVIRKTIAKSEGVEKFKKFEEKFVQGCVKRKTMTAKQARKTWNELRHFGSYSFNLAHAVSYSMISMWTMWMKAHYPIEFMTALLTHCSNDDKKMEYIREVRRLGINVGLPDVGVSFVGWTADYKKNAIVGGLADIKNVGDKACEEIIRARKAVGGFKNFFHFVHSIDKRKVNKRVIKSLLEASAFRNILPNEADFIENWDSYWERIKKHKDEDIHKLRRKSMIKKKPVEEIYFKNVESVLPFEISADIGRKYRGLLEIIKKNYGITKINDVDFSKGNKNHRLFLGKVVEMKFGYSQKVKESGARGSAGESLGGVYCNFEDESNFIMLIFTKDLYRKKKAKTEKLEGNFILAEAANDLAGRVSLFCHNYWTLDDIVSGRANIELDLIRKVNKLNYFEGILDCKKCPAYKNCKAPVPPSPSRYNVMVVGEAPGGTEDSKGLGFVGKAGITLWEILKDYGYKRDMFHVTNVFKCFPKKTPTPTQLDFCGNIWLDKEIRTVKPKIILALGGSAMYYFNKQKSGITAMSGTAEWSPKYNAVIVYATHPASLLYRGGEPEVRKVFMKGIKRFDKIYRNFKV